MTHSQKSVESIELLKGNRLRRLDLEKYLPALWYSFRDRPFRRISFCKHFNLSKPSACRILKAMKDQNLVEVIKGKRIRKQGRFRGQEPNTYLINGYLVADFLSKNSLSTS